MNRFALGLAGLLGGALVTVAAMLWAGPGPLVASGGDDRPEAAVAAAPVAPAQTARDAAGALTAFEVARTERFLENRAACLGCHRIRGRGGQIGPSLEGLAARADAEYVRSVIRDPAGVLPGTIMPRQPMPDAEIERLTAYLLAPASDGATPPDPAVVPQAPPALDAGREEDGAALYARHCAACHGAEGRGDGWNAPNLPVAPTAHADPALMGARPDDSLFDAIHSGAYVLDGSARMPPFGEMLTTAQIRALVAHIRALCDCAEPAWAGG